MTLKDKLKSLRTEMNMTQEEAAEKLGFRVTSIRNCTLGHKNSLHGYRFEYIID